MKIKHTTIITILTIGLYINCTNVANRSMQLGSNSTNKKTSQIEQLKKDKFCNTLSEWVWAENIKDKTQEVGKKSIIKTNPRANNISTDTFEKIVKKVEYIKQNTDCTGNNRDTISKELENNSEATQTVIQTNKNYESIEKMVQSLNFIKLSKINVLFLYNSIKSLNN